MNPLWIACAPARPPLSNPIPLSNVLASITFSTAFVQAPASRASFAFTPSFINVSKHSFASDIAAIVTFPPAQVVASLA